MSIPSQAVSFGRRSAAPPHAAPTRAGPPPVAEPATLAHPVSAVPWATAALALGLSAVFLLQGVTALTPLSGGQFSYLSLVFQGASNHQLVFEECQFGRLLTAPLLHGGVAHLVGNVVILVLIGWRLERLIGAPWVLAIFALSALGGELGSTLLTPAGAASVGASGAIMGLLGAALSSSFHAAAFDVAGKLRGLALRFCLPALIPTSGHVDYAAHFGGALTGAVLGLVLHAVWPEMEDRPHREGTAATVAVGLGIAAAVALMLALLDRPIYAARQAQLMPEAVIPHGAQTLGRQGFELALRFPGDPRAHLAAALGALQSGQPELAEQQLRVGLSVTDPLGRDFPPAARQTLTLALAEALKSEQRQAEATALARPVCTGKRPPAWLSAASARPGKLCADLGF